LLFCSSLCIFDMCWIRFATVWCLFAYSYLPNLWRQWATLHKITISFRTPAKTTVCWQAVDWQFLAIDVFGYLDQLRTMNAHRKKLWVIFFDCMPACESRGNSVIKSTCPTCEKNALSVPKPCCPGYGKRAGSFSYACWSCWHKRACECTL
jgi:hypothetical protein